MAALASKPGAKQAQVARGLGGSPCSVARGKKQSATASASVAPGVNAPQELERQNRALRRENAALREQRALRKKSARHRPGSPARRPGVSRSLAGEFPLAALGRAPGVRPSGDSAAQKKAERPRARDDARTRS